MVDLTRAGELLERELAATHIEDQRRARRLAAELELLVEFHYQRERRRYDYGGGQRAKEITRRRRELAAAVNRHGVSSSEELIVAFRPWAAGELRAAWLSVGAPRLARAEREPGFRQGTRSGIYTVEAWRKIEEWVDGYERRGD